MNKIMYSVLALAVAAFTFTSCEDVPAPYGDPNNGGNGEQPGTELKTIYSETFDNGSTQFTFKDVSLSDGLTYVWKVGSYNDNGYLNASAFANSASHASESWAVSPAINLSDSKTATLSFTHAINKLNDTSTMKDMMTAWASTDYAGDVNTATWQKLEIPTYPAGTSWSFSASGDISLNDYCGKNVTIAFRYTSTDSNSGGWEIDNFEVKGDGTPMATPSDPSTPDTPDTPGASGNVQIDGTDLTLVNPAVEAGTETITFKPSDFFTTNATDVTTITLSDGTKVVFDKNGETNGPKFYCGADYANIRVYKNNKITFEGKKAIAKVVLNCDVYNNANQVGNETATVSASGNNLVYTNVFTGSTGGGTQLRFNTVTITYAK